MNKETMTGIDAQGIPSANSSELQAIAKAYRLVNVLVLLLLCAFIGIFLMPNFVDTGSFLFFYPFILVLLEIILIVSTAYLGTKVAGMGWILSFFLSFFGNFIVAIIFTRLAAKRLRENGYKVGLINAILTT